MHACIHTYIVIGVVVVVDEVDDELDDVIGAHSITIAGKTDRPNYSLRHALHMREVLVYRNYNTTTTNKGLGWCQ